jgi:hypothetical protein
MVMKKVFLIVILVVGAMINSDAQNHRIYPFNAKVESVVNSNIMKLSVQAAFKDSTLFLAPSIAFDVFSKENDTGEYNIGIIPGIGYGLKWNPAKWKSDYLIGIDVFAQAALSTQDGNARYFNIRILPTFTILNWVHIGYGPMWRVGLNGTSNISTSVFTFGITRSL